MNYEFYVCDVETTGLDSRRNDVIELSLYRLSEKNSEAAQKTWLIRPTSFDNVEVDALRINGHKLDQIKQYPEASKVIVEVENWLAEDGATTTQRALVGQNISFDKDMLEQLWIKCQSKDSFPFGRRYLDTMIVEVFIDYCHSKTVGTNKMAEGYSLSNLVKKYGVKNTKAHTAAADTLATKEVFEQQVQFFSQVLSRALYNQDEGLIRRGE
jgi:DNA polymerase III alpha subunit (gram-positive type)